MAIKGFPRTKKVMLGSHTFEVYTIGFLAATTELAQVTLRLWERKGILPKPILRIPGTMRYYTASEVLAYAGAVSEHYTSGRNLKKLSVQLNALSISLREKLKQYAAQKTPLPASVLALHIPPRPRWTHEIEKTYSQKEDKDHARPRSKTVS